MSSSNSNNQTEKTISKVYNQAQDHQKWNNILKSQTIDYTKIIMINQKQVLTEKPLAIATTYTYPRDYFNATNSKPVVNVYYKESSLETLNDVFAKRYARGDKILSMLITACLFKSIKDDSDILDGKWESYGQAIGEKDAAVNIGNILTVNELEGGDPLPAGGDIPAGYTNLNIPYIICCLYRVIRSAQYPDYVSKLIKNMKLLAPGIESQLDQLILLSNSQTELLLDKNFTALVAAIDMFYFLFPDGPKGYLRTGTISSRFRDCAALTMYYHVKDVVSEDMARQIYSWLLTNKLEKDFIRMFATSEEEYYIINSYFPYQIDLGLVKKTAYSVSANPNIYTFSAVIGTLLGDSRSRNAREVPGLELNDLMFNSFLAAYANRHCRGISQKFIQTVYEEDNINEPKPPKEVTVGPWITFMQNRDNLYTDEMKKWFSSVQEKLNNSRPKTVASYLYENIPELVID